MTAETSRRIVLDFYDAVVNRRDFGAASAYLGDVYIQHRADAPDGVDGLRRFMLRERNPQTHVDVRRVFVDGDHVIIHAHVVPRLENVGAPTLTSSASTAARWSSTGTWTSRSRPRPQNSNGVI